MSKPTTTVTMTMTTTTHPATTTATTTASPAFLAERYLAAIRSSTTNSYASKIRPKPSNILHTGIATAKTDNSNSINSNSGNGLTKQQRSTSSSSLRLSAVQVQVQAGLQVTSVKAGADSPTPSTSPSSSSTGTCTCTSSLQENIPTNQHQHHHMNQQQQHMNHNHYNPMGMNMNLDTDMEEMLQSRNGSTSPSRGRLRLSRSDSYQTRDSASYGQEQEKSQQQQSHQHQHPSQLQQVLQQSDEEEDLVNWYPDADVDADAHDDDAHDDDNEGTRRKWTQIQWRNFRITQQEEEYNLKSNQRHSQNQKSRLQMNNHNNIVDDDADDDVDNDETTSDVNNTPTEVITNKANKAFDLGRNLGQKWLVNSRNANAAVAKSTAISTATDSNIPNTEKEHGKVVEEEACWNTKPFASFKHPSTQQHQQRKTSLSPTFNTLEGKNFFLVKEQQQQQHQLQPPQSSPIRTSSFASPKSKTKISRPFQQPKKKTFQKNDRGWIKNNNRSDIEEHQHQQQQQQEQQQQHHQVEEAPPFVQPQEQQHSNEQVCENKQSLMEEVGNKPSITATIAATAIPSTTTTPTSSSKVSHDRKWIKKVNVHPEQEWNPPSSSSSIENLQPDDGVICTPPISRSLSRMYPERPKKSNHKTSKIKIKDVGDVSANARAMNGNDAGIGITGTGSVEKPWKKKRSNIAEEGGVKNITSTMIQQQQDHEIVENDCNDVNCDIQPNLPQHQMISDDPKHDTGANVDADANDGADVVEYHEKSENKNFLAGVKLRRVVKVGDTRKVGIPQQQQQQQQQQQFTQASLVKPPQAQPQPMQPQAQVQPQQLHSQSVQPQPQTLQQPQQQPQQQPRRKLHLTQAGRQALTKAVLSSFKHPLGQIEPTLLEEAMRLTGLSSNAIHNAATVARKREVLKRKRVLEAQQQQSQANQQKQQQVSQQGIQRQQQHMNQQQQRNQQQQQVVPNQMHHQYQIQQQQQQLQQQQQIQATNLYHHPQSQLNGSISTNTNDIPVLPPSNVTTTPASVNPHTMTHHNHNTSIHSTPQQQHQQLLQQQRLQQQQQRQQLQKQTPMSTTATTIKGIHNSIYNNNNHEMARAHALKQPYNHKMNISMNSTSAQQLQQQQQQKILLQQQKAPTKKKQSNKSKLKTPTKSPIPSKQALTMPSSLSKFNSDGVAISTATAPTSSQKSSSSSSSNVKPINPVLLELQMKMINESKQWNRIQSCLLLYPISSKTSKISKHNMMKQQHQLNGSQSSSNVTIVSGSEITPSSHTKASTLLPSPSSLPSSSSSSSSLPPVDPIRYIGGICRTKNTQPILIKKDKKTNELKISRQNLMQQLKLIQSKMQNKSLLPPPPPSSSLLSSSSSSSSAYVSSTTTVSILDVTDKYKRVKLQPRQKSKGLERTLRSHRKNTCESILKRQKEFNSLLKTHTNEFYKYHRSNRITRTKFCKSIRDYVITQRRKKEKDEENEEKARINALRANDMEAYTALLQDTRNDRLKFLLDQTGQYLNKIEDMLKDQNENGNGIGNSDDETKEKETEMHSYYESAHVRQEIVKQPSILVGGKLKEYQVGGLSWLVSLYNNKLNGILADEMGLGKTIQTIALIAYLMEFKENRGPYLVIVPLSTLSNWVNEFRRWCPSATVIVYKGTPAQRKGLYKSAVRVGHFNVLLTTYEYIIKDKSSLRKIQWQYSIVDEGHRMKNAQSKFAVTLGTQYTTMHRVLLTGTPLQNSLPELWSLLNFLLPTIFNSVETFDQWFNKPFAQFGSSATGDNTNSSGEAEEVVTTEERMLIIQRLHELLRPFMLRRVKADVLNQLPEKVEKVLRCELSSWQKQLYKQISYSVLEDGTKSSKRGLNNVVMQLRKVCNHPYMFSPEGYYITEDIIRTSGKVELLDRMLPRLKAAGHRILMFFQMTAAMTILEDYFKYRNFLSLRLDGSTTGEERERRMDLFNAPNSPYFIFLLSTRAGGLGLNLVSADTVIIFDSDWNPMMDLQAQDRAHRIGQKKVVSVFRLITNSPVEEKILSRANEKLNMSELIVEAGKFDKSSLEEDTTDERQKMMELLLLDFDSNTVSQGQATCNLPSSDEEDEEDGNEDENNEEVDFNELLSRNDEDYEFYTKLDNGEIEDDEYYKTAGLLTDPNDIPDWIKYPNGKKGDDPKNENGEIDGKRRAAASGTMYSDGLTEKQFLRMMEKQAQTEEDEAKARKVEWKLKREEKANVVAAAGAAEEAKLDVGDAIVQPPLPDEILNRLISITKSVIAIRDVKTKRRYSEIFRDQPSRTEYPDYYKVIQHPVAINDIMKKCRSKEYTAVIEFISDWKLMFANAKTFNGESSWIVTDAGMMETELQRLLDKNKLPQTEEQLSEEAVPKKRKLKLKLSLKKKPSDVNTVEPPKRKRGRPSKSSLQGSAKKQKIASFENK